MPLTTAAYPAAYCVLRTNEERKYGEYRTARFVMQAWDDQALGSVRAARA